MEMQESSLLSYSPDKSPSFDTYTPGKLAAIAARVIQELNNETEYDGSNFQDLHTVSCEQTGQENDDEKSGDNDEDESGGEFEFSILSGEEESIPIAASEIFCNGQIRPVYPLFNSELLSGTIKEETTAIETKATPHRLPLRQLFSEERELASTSSASSEADELDGVEPGTYCVWSPKKAGESSLVLTKKSGSTGSSKWRKFRELLHRSHSDGKDTYVFLAPMNRNNKKAEEAKQEATRASNTDAAKKGGGVEEECVRRYRDVKESEKRRSYLPYHQDLVGVFAYVTAHSRNWTGR